MGSTDQAGATNPHQGLPTGVPVDRRLLDAVVGVAAGLELEPTLRRIVDAAASLTGARYAALGVLGDDGMHRAFVHAGMHPAEAEAIGAPPRGHGLLGHITRTGAPVRVSRLQNHPASSGFPVHHPPMESFLGVPVGIGGRVVGNLYLADRPGGFREEDEDVVVALAAAAAVAVENARLYEASRSRELWVSAASEVATAMLSGADEEDALALIARRSREVARAATAALVLPGLHGTWVLEVAVGDGAGELIGTLMPADGRSASVIASGRGVRFDDLGAEKRLQVAGLRRFGPAIYAPLTAGEEHMGVLLLLRAEGGEPFSAEDLTTAQAFACQAALALQLADHRRRAEDAELLEERQRIARDLHDLVVQELFALGIRLNTLRPEAGPAAVEGIDSSLESLDRVVRQIRATIRALRDAGEPTALSDRVLAEIGRSRVALGFAPDLSLEPAADILDTLVPPDVADDVVAVVREGLSNAARHAAAATVTVTVRAEPDGVRVHVTDDGAGLPPDGSRRSSGLANLAERARRHGGACCANAGDGGGTSLVWQVPLSP